MILLIKDGSWHEAFLVSHLTMFPRLHFLLKQKSSAIILVNRKNNDRRRDERIYRIEYRCFQGSQLLFLYAFIYCRITNEDGLMSLIQGLAGYQAARQCFFESDQLPDIRVVYRIYHLTTIQPDIQFYHYLAGQFAFFFDV